MHRVKPVLHIIFESTDLHNVCAPRFYADRINFMSMYLVYTKLDAGFVRDAMHSLLMLSAYILYRLVGKKLDYYFKANKPVCVRLDASLQRDV